MASNLKRKVALKGQSRSKFCAEPTTRSKTSAPCLRLAGHKGKHRPTTMRTAKQSVGVVAPVIAEATVTAEGGIGTVTILPDAGPEGRDVQVQRSARRAKASPKGTQVTATEAVVARSAKPKTAGK